VRRLVERVLGILRKPRQALPLTLAESGAPSEVLRGYVLPLAAPGAIALFLSDGLFGAWYAPTEIFNTVIPGGWVREPLHALITALVVYALSVGAWAATAALMALSAPLFGGMRDQSGALKAAAYTLTPLWLAGAAQLFSSVPYLNWLPGVALVAGVAWAAFLAVIAVPLHLGTPDAKAPAHAVGSVAVAALVVGAAYLLASSALAALWSAR
jgi:hypothetical protein